jgi:hypothetical protein
MRMRVVRGFARYMPDIDPRTEIPPAGLLPFRQRWRAPFIYSETDIVTLMRQAVVDSRAAVSSDTTMRVASVFAYGVV